MKKLKCSFDYGQIFRITVLLYFLPLVSIWLKKYVLFTSRRQHGSSTIW